MGFLVFCMGFALLFLGWQMILGVIQALFYIIQSIFGLIGGAYVHFFIDEPAMKVYKKNKDKREQAEKDRVLKEQKLIKQKNTEHEKKMAMAALNKVNDIRYRYPLANEELYDMYYNNFYDSSIKELEWMEENIKNSHVLNKSKPYIDNKKNYNLKDLEEATPIDEKTEYPISMKLFKINNIYVADILDMKNDKHRLYQSKIYSNILNFMVTILNQMDVIRERKNQVQSSDIDYIFNMQNKQTNNDIFEVREQAIIDRINKGMKKKE